MPESVYRFNEQVYHAKHGHGIVKGVTGPTFVQSIQEWMEPTYLVYFENGQHIPSLYENELIPSSKAAVPDCKLWDQIRLAGVFRYLNESTTVDNEIRGGVPVLKGTRISIGQLLAELAETPAIPELADSWDVCPDTLKKVIEGLAIYFDISQTKSVIGSEATPLLNHTA